MDETCGDGRHFATGQLAHPRESCLFRA
jgi:hypothetical protein